MTVGRRAGARRWMVWCSGGGIASGALFLAVYGCGSDFSPILGDGNTPSGVLTGPCTPGATSQCHVETGRSGEIVNCFVGTQLCGENAVWGPCAGAGMMASVHTPIVTTSGSGGLHVQSITTSDASSTSSGCAANPCDPACIGWDTDAGTLQPDGALGTGVTVQGTTIGFSNFPSAKCVAQAGQNNCVVSAGCKVYAPAPNDLECSYDYCCAHEAGAPDGSTGTCMQWIADASAAGCTAFTGVDYTAGVGCSDTSGVIHIPVCNRGTQDSPSTGKLFLAGYPGNPNSIGTNNNNNTCANPGTPSEGCLIDLSVVTIKAGSCIEINVANAGKNPSTETGVVCSSTSDFNTGNRTSMINPPATTTLPNSTNNLASAYGASNYTQLAETDKCNNYSFVYTQTGSCSYYGTPPPGPATYTFTYTASCPAPQHVQWNQFAYDTLVPTQSDVLFTATAQGILVDGGVGTATTPVTLAHPGAVGSTDPASCPMNGSVSGCPKSLPTLLGAGQYDEVLTLSITLTDGTAIPTVNSWALTYNCIDYE